MPQADLTTEQALHVLARRTTEVLGLPIAAISCVDPQHERLLVGRGIMPQSLPPNLSFYALLKSRGARERVLQCADLHADQAFRTHPLVAGEEQLRFYAAAAFDMNNGKVSGVLAVFDTQPRTLGPREMEALCNLADLVQVRMKDLIEQDGIPHFSGTPAASPQSRELAQLKQLLEKEKAARQHAEYQLLRARERYELALHGSNLALWDWDLTTGTAYFNEGWSQLTGAQPGEVVARGEEVLSWGHPDDREAFRAAMEAAVRGATPGFEAEYRIRNAAGKWIWVSSLGKVTQRDGSGRALRMTGTLADVTQRKQAEERAEYLATRDPLTSLPNRMLLNDRLEQGVAGAARNRKRLAFMFIDLDRFKTINDSLGHHVGDELLKQVATRLSSCVRASDTVARLGGDEFAVILVDLAEEDGARHVAENMINSLANPIVTGNLQLNTSCSIGISLYPADGRDSATLMKNADAAMYHAKERGRNNFQFFSKDMNDKAMERLSIESYLRQALQRDELALHYQPRLSLATGEMVGVEALIRWQHPRRGLLPAEKFIPIAEDAGLIMPLGTWVLETACRQIRTWQKRGMSELRLSVNLAPGQARDAEGLLRSIEKALSTSGLNARFLEFELTEGLLMQNTKEKTGLLQSLGERGIGMSIDDFGTGYSSLYHLKGLPVDSLKIDGSFVRDVVSDPSDEAVIRAIVAMGHSMRLKIIAESVETEAQFTALKVLGCDEYQGLHCSPPLTVDEFEARYFSSNRF